MFVKNLLNLRRFYSYHVLSLCGWGFLLVLYFPAFRETNIAIAIIIGFLWLIIFYISMFFFLIFLFFEIVKGLRIKNKFILKNIAFAIFRIIGILSFIVFYFLFTSMWLDSYLYQNLFIRKLYLGEITSILLTILPIGILIYSLCRYKIE